MDNPAVQGRPYVNPPLQAILDLHGELLAEHGGAPGIRDLGALEASLARPYRPIAYGDERLTVFDLAAAACVRICRNDPFVDGNKRAAFVALGLVLGLNGFELDVAEREAADTILALAAHTLTEEAFCNWVADHAYDIGDSEP